MDKKPRDTEEITHADIAEMLRSSDKIIRDNNKRLCAVHEEMITARKVQDEFTPTMKKYTDSTERIEEDMKRFLTDTKDMFHEGMERMITAQVVAFKAISEQKDKFPVSAKVVGGLLGTIIFLVLSLIAMIFGVDYVLKLRDGLV
jgi:hypothetical protein